MNIKIREMISNMLPKKNQEWRYTYVKGKMRECSKNDEFLYDNAMISLLKMDSHAQFGQDAFIWKLIFNCKRDGMFLDIGANHPTKINNTFLFEENGWKGFAFEPIPRLAEQWGEIRKTKCINVAIGEYDGEVEFTETQINEVSGINVKNEYGGSLLKYKVPQRTLKIFLEEHQIRKVDFVSLDVEGYEFEVLRGIEFEKVDITCFCIENNRDGDVKPDMGLRRFMLQKGYRLVARLTIDDVFLKESYFEKLKV